MQVIPVIDIRNGAVVRAVAGRRSDYAPIVTPLARSADPNDVARGLMSLHYFDALYIADLDAIEGRGGNVAAISSLAAMFPDARLWVDAGLRRIAQADLLWRDAPNVDFVLGSESLEDAEELEAARSDPRLILSLDFSSDGFLGDPRLREPRFWPRRIIVMTLARVGAGQGPDVARLTEIIARAEGRSVYAAGGLRDLDDLRALEKAGAAGALVATALHDGRLTRDDLLRLSPK